MPSSHTTRKRLEKQAAGENNNAWGGYLNLNTIDLVDECFGVVCVAMTTAGDSTLTTNNGLSDQGRRSQIILTGTPTSNVSLFVPAVESFYIVRNKMGGTRKVTVKNAGGTNGVDFSGAASGAEQGLVLSDGVHVREIVRTVSTGALSPFTRGMIMPFYGSVGGIPSGWLNCDGTNGTPNLNDKFILGTTSNTNVDTSGGSLSNLTATSNGDHTHGGSTGSTTLTLAQIPAHAHGYLTEAVGNHPTGTGASEERGAATVSLSTTSVGGNASHNHTISTGGGHTHTVTPTRPPYHYLLYIMKS